MKTKIKKAYSYSLILLIACYVLISCSQGKPPVYQDVKYSSQVFNTERTYRIYFPEGYEKSDQNYPVIYYFHGWGGRYFSDENALLEYEMIGDLVDKYQVILVMMDGNMEESEPRPYNVGFHEHVKYQVQMKDYFLELVSNTDSVYRTKTDRNSRAIIGYSMGGFISFYMSGKYPHLISSAADLTGSIEWYVGYPNNHTLYPLRYTFENLRDVRIRLQNSSVGPSSPLNKEVNNGAEWDDGVTYEYWEFEGGHKVDDPGETMAYEKAMKFVTDGFKNPMPRKKQWSHYDLYSNFDVWDYQVESEKDTSGYIYLTNVNPSGFGYYTCAWLPNGPSLGFSSKIATAAIYEPNTAYQILDFNKNNWSLDETIQKADSSGRLSFAFTDSEHELGIYKSGDSPIVRVVDYSINENQKMLRSGQENTIELKMINVGELPSEAMDIELSIYSPDSMISVLDSITTFSISQERLIDLNPIRISCDKLPTTDGSPFEARIKVKIKYDTVVFESDFVIPVFFDVPLFDSLSVDDGLMVRDSIFGIGNGNSLVSPGEEIMIYQGNHRLQLFYDDPYIISERISDEVLPCFWQGDGITMSSVIKIDENCPPGHRFEIIGRYETRAYNPMFRYAHWGKVEFEVSK